jgi:hypothetical protein
MTQGDRIETRDYGPHGEHHTCRSYMVGTQRLHELQQPTVGRLGPLASARPASFLTRSGLTS